MIPIIFTPSGFFGFHMTL